MKHHFRTKADVANTWIHWAKTCYNVINVNNSVVFPPLLSDWSERRTCDCVLGWFSFSVLAGSAAALLFRMVWLLQRKATFSRRTRSRPFSLEIPPPVWRFRPPGFYPPRLWEGGVAAIFPPSPVLMSLELSSSISPMTTTATSPSRPRSQLTLFLLAGRQERERERERNDIAIRQNTIF